jgi:MFS family permease
MVLFEVPTGVVADTLGRRASYLLGTVTLTASTLLYVLLWQVEALRQALLNDMIPSQQRATILSFDSLMSSAGGVWGQPVLGRAADAWGYAPSYAMSAPSVQIAVRAATSR